MTGAKTIHISPISARDANQLVKRIHYSGKVVNNSQLHFGVFLNGSLEGVMQYGPSLDKRKIINTVEGTLWNDFIELNRMAFSDRLPRNSESRALSISFKLIKKYYTNIKWVITFADAAQCGDGAIYRAAGFKLIGIKHNNQIWVSPEGKAASRITLTTGKNILNNGSSSMKIYARLGWKPLPGYQLKYIYFLDKEAEERLLFPVIPFSKIDEKGAGMYKGKRIKRTKRQDSNDQLELGGSFPTCALHE